MRFLLDSHVWLWMLVEPERLGEPARAALADSGNEGFVSVASIWEIGIKHVLGKLTLPAPVDTLVTASRERFDLQLLPIGAEHALLAPTLPPHHKDPFDRMLVAQALVEGLTLVTADTALRSYSCPLLWATGS